MIEMKEIVSESYNYILSNPLTRMVKKMQYLLSASLTKNDGYTLDLGCGMGNYLPYLKDRRFAVGLDNSPFLISQARERYQGFPLVEGDILSLPFPGETFDTIISLSVLEHLHDLHRALDEVHRVLRPDGEFVVIVPAWEGFLFKIGREVTTKRHVESRLNIDYDAICKERHINLSRQIVKQLRQKFAVTTVRGAPFLIPLVHVNIWIGIHSRRKSP